MSDISTDRVEFQWNDLQDAGSILNLSILRKLSPDYVHGCWEARSKKLLRSAIEDSSRNILQGKLDRARDLLLDWISQGQPQNFPTTSDKYFAVLMAEIRERAYFLLAIGWLIAAICGLTFISGRALPESFADIFVENHILPNLSPTVKFLVAFLYASFVGAVMLKIALLAIARYSYFSSFVDVEPHTKTLVESQKIWEWFRIKLSERKLIYRSRFVTGWVAVGVFTLIGVGVRQHFGKDSRYNLVQETASHGWLAVDGNEKKDGIRVHSLVKYTSRTADVPRFQMEISCKAQGIRPAEFIALILTMPDRGNIDKVEFRRKNSTSTQAAERYFGNDPGNNRIIFYLKPIETMSLNEATSAFGLKSALIAVKWATSKTTVDYGKDIAHAARGYYDQIFSKNPLLLSITYKRDSNTRSSNAEFQFSDLQAQIKSFFERCNLQPPY